MKHYSELTDEFIDACKPEFIYDYHNSFYANIPLAFDIETSSTYIEDEKTAFMYVWAFGFADEVFYSRTWGEFIELLTRISTLWELGGKRKAIVYVHNLSYEFQFMRKYLTWEKVFAVDERKPIKALTSENIEFRDSYILSGFSLAKTAENLTHHKIEKLIGDLNYDLVRHSNTSLTDDELKYIEYDIIIISYYIDEQIIQYGNIGNIPLTNTGRVRTYVKDRCFNTDGKRDNNKRKKYFDLMDNMTLQPKHYTQLKRGFMGGYTHANNLYVGKTVENVFSIDFTSSYPSVMVSEKFPLSSPISVEVNTLDELEELMEKYNVIFDVRFKNIESSIYYENYISESKCFILENATINNGRVFRADDLVTTLTELDYHIIKACYQWEQIEVSNIHYFFSNYLPKPIINSILELYQGKTELKDVAGREVEYVLSKGMLNSVYGMTVTDIAKDNHIYEDGWELEKIDLGDELDKHNRSKNRFLYYAWGVWITAYARYNLWSGILAMGTDYIYSDTDSIKFFNYDTHKEYIDLYNKELLIKQQQVIKHYNLDETLFKPKTIEGIEKPLGVWDFEGSYSRFKTLGAKRYLTEENNRLTLTVAGLSKKNGLNYMIKKAGTNTGVFNMFNDSLFIPDSQTGKNTHTYIDETKTFKVIDYQGDELEVTSLSSIHLESVEFSLNISNEYKQFIESLRKGYLLKGDTKNG